ncbi:TPA: LPXTG cell wall anchor domain-containing protein, partial [Streptococcus pyogenes]|nr:LPXTG cell wall anchor domain-containing protein [Streptococcus pyogenes]
EPKPETPQPVTPADNGDNNGNNNGTTPAQSAAASTPQYMDGQRELPNTGTEDNASLAALGLLGVLSGFGLVARKKKED